MKKVFANWRECNTRSAVRSKIVLTELWEVQRRNAWSRTFLIEPDLGVAKVVITCDQVSMRGRKGEGEEEEEEEVSTYRKVST